MIEKQTLHGTKLESEEPSEPARHIPVPKEASEPTDAEVIERIRSCH